MAGSWREKSLFRTMILLITLDLSKTSLCLEIMEVKLHVWGDVYLKMATSNTFNVYVCALALGLFLNYDSSEALWSC